MLNKNKLTLAGNIGSFESKKLTNDKLVVNYSVATTESWKNKESGEYDNATTWHKCKAFGKTAEFLEKYFGKGSPIYLEGSLEYNKAKEGGAVFVEVSTSDVQHSNSSVLGLNEIRVIGNTAKNPVLRWMPSGDAVLNFSVATTRYNDTTDWHNIVAFGKTAEYIYDKIKDGSRNVIVDGKIKPRKWQDDNGKDKYITEIYLKDVKIVTITDKKSDGKQQEQQQSQEAPAPLPINVSDAEFADRFNNFDH